MFKILAAHLFLYSLFANAFRFHGLYNEEQSSSSKKQSLVLGYSQLNGCLLNTKAFFNASTYHLGLNLNSRALDVNEDCELEIVNCSADVLCTKCNTVFDNDAFVAAVDAAELLGYDINTATCVESLFLLQAGFPEICEVTQDSLLGELMGCILDSQLPSKPCETTDAPTVSPTVSPTIAPTI